MDALARVDDEARLLAQDERLLVLVQDLERDRRGVEVVRADRGLLNADLRTGGDVDAGLQHRMSVHRHVARLDEPARLGTGQGGEVLDDGEVEPRGFGGGEVADGGHVRASCRISSEAPSGSATGSSLAAPPSAGAKNERTTMVRTPRTIAESARLNEG